MYMYNGYIYIYICFIQYVCDIYIYIHIKDAFMVNIPWRHERYLQMMQTQTGLVHSSLVVPKSGSFLVRPMENFRAIY